MRPFSRVVSILATVGTLAAGTAGAQQASDSTHTGWYFDLHPNLTEAEFKEFTADVGAVLRSRQLGDSATVPKGKVDLSVQFANNTIDDSKPAWNDTTSHGGDRHLGQFMSFPRFGARFGLSDHADLGLSGGLAPDGHYGSIGVDTKIALVKQGPTRPVSVSIRPSVAVLIAPSEVWAGTLSVDLSVSRAFGPVSPYGGVAAMTSGAIARSTNVNLDAANAGRSLAYAGVSYRWRRLLLSGEVEQGGLTRYAFSVGTRF